MKLIAVMELSVVRGSVDPHFVDDFEPAVSQPAQGARSADRIIAWEPVGL